MTRYIGLIVFTGGFLLISASLRESAFAMLNSLAAYTNLYSPYSYIVLAVIALAGITLTLRTGQTAR